MKTVGWIILIVLIVILFLFLCLNRDGSIEGSLNFREGSINLIEGWKPTSLTHFDRVRPDNASLLHKSYGYMGDTLDCRDKVVLQVKGYIYNVNPRLYNKNGTFIVPLESYTDVENRIYTFIFCSPNVDTLFLETDQDYLPDEIIDIFNNKKYFFKYPTWELEPPSTDSRLRANSSDSYNCERGPNGTFLWRLTREN